jgi:hypothetical protein
VRGTVYFDIPLLNYVGWFVLMLLAPLTWILIARQHHWRYSVPIWVVNWIRGFSRSQCQPPA